MNIMSSEKTFWYPNGRLRHRIGEITDILSLGFVEVKDLETFEYYIIDYNKLEIIKQNEKVRN